MADQPSANPSGPSGAYPSKPMTADQQQAWVTQLVSGTMGQSSTATAGKYGRPEENSMIYMGKGKTSLSERQAAKAEGGYAPMARPVQGNNMQKYSDVRLTPLDWSSDQMAKFVNQGVMNKIPGFDVNMGMPEILSAWDDMVKSAYAMNSKDPNNPRWTPQDVMNTYANPKGKFGTVVRGNWEYDIATGEKIRYVGPLSKTTTSTQINELTREDALALTKQSMATMLGRMPTNDEVMQYMGILNGYEKAHPQTTTTTQQIDPNTGEAANSSSVTTGGSTAAGKQALVEEQLRQTKEYGAYQAATTGMSWLAQAISKGVL